MNLVVLTLLVSLGSCMLIVMTRQLHGRFTFDHVQGVQKFHAGAVPRVGGIGLYVGLLVAYWLAGEQAAPVLEPLLVAGLPALIAGLLEDTTRRVSVRARLGATLFSGMLICWMTGQALTRLDVPLLDTLLQVPLLAVLFTAFAMAGLANALNIIDGLNGLASGVLTICTATLGVLALQAGDTTLALTATLVAAATIGFWLVNFPFGKIFLGDGGAYFGGFALAWLAVQLPLRNPDISPWISLLVCAYPIVETVYSILRRLAGHHSPGEPDAAHLHSLLMIRCTERVHPHWPRWAQHSLVSLPVWLLAGTPALLAVQLANRSSGELALVFAAAFLAYHRVYRRVAASATAR